MTTWQIGESGTTVALDGAGRGELTFTVTNAGTAQDRAVLTITPLDGAADGWFTVPEPQRPVGPGASVLYPVGVTVPPTTAAGTYGLQGVAYSADHDPGESSATSKRVSLTVGEPAPRKGVPTWIFLVIAAVVLLVIAVIAFLLTRGGDGPPEETVEELRSTAEPAISGTADLGETVTADEGEWSVDRDETAFQWVRCQGSPELCTPIPGATTADHAVTGDDVDHSLRVEVTATAGDDDVTARSAPTSVVPSLSPTTLPQISGTAQVGQTLTATTGVWSRPDAALTIQWQFCNSQITACGPIPGATGTTYVVSTGDVSGALRAEITATLAGATSVAHTPATGTVASPIVSVPPVIGMTSGPAAATLQAAGLRPFIVTYESQQRSDCDGGATGQVPAGGTQVLRDSEVTVEIPFVPDGPILGHICN